MKIKSFAILLSILFLNHQAFAQEGFHGSVEPIPAKIAENMINKTWHKGCPLPLSSFSYLTLNYWGFDNKSHVGHLIVLKLIAGETLQIFQELYQIKFPIEKINLPDVYATSKTDNWSTIDWKSAEDNNTNGFFCRDDDQNPGQYSPHSYGIAVDINPVFNPSKIANNQIMPKAGKKYFDRSLAHVGMINEEVVAIFAKYGWKWGGYFSNDKVDYQHFQKDMDEHYLSPTLIIFRK